MAQIFFVDDDPITLQILGKAAQLLGHQPVLIETGQAVLDQVTRVQPDLIMMDMMMPDMDGLDVLTQLRANPTLAAIPVVILSAGAALDDGDRAKAAGAQEYIAKPVSLSVLLATIKKYAGG
ncbi:MAG: response regulator [Anaerolineaceae bacterium]|nr:response regulator [Anaerolineaceae bacterium]